ncbi:MAG TPA: efflux RND transporter periplasmic adaptor subunit [Gemmatimonadaceae bacterium]|nr:efflux RND transporter periplasmic adaptor subunit [Gemmatimonadaceae bacterium]
MNKQTLINLLGGACLALGVAACNSGSGSASAATSDAGNRAQRPDSAGGRGARQAPTITLAPGDVAIVGKETIEEGAPITGDLKPIETVDVRARLEGDLLGVYVREGQHVAAGELLARFEASEQQSIQESAVADRASARTDLATAQWNLDQSAELFKAGAIAERDFKVAQQAVDAARARLAASEAKLHTSSLASRDTRVVAPTSGIIGTRSVEQGERVARGASMFTIVRNEVLELAAAVPARQANAVRVGQAVHFVADARRFDGRVSRVSPTIDPTSRSITVYVDVPNADGQLKGGTFATGRVVSRTLANVITVPTAAIRQSQEGGHPFAYKLDERIVNVAPLEVGVVDERLGKAEVVSGLALGDRVIVGNVGTLGRGMQAIILGEERTRGGSTDPNQRPRRGSATR